MRPFPSFLKSLLYAEMRCFSAFSFKKSAANYLHSKKKMILYTLVLYYYNLNSYREEDKICPEKQKPWTVTALPRMYHTPLQTLRLSTP